MSRIVYQTSSVVGLFGLGLTLPLEVRGVVFLGVPSVLGMGHIVAPAHGLGILNGIGESSEAHLHIGVGVVSTTRPAHQRHLVVTPRAKVNGPSMAWSLVRWVTVHVLALNHVDSGDLVSLGLGVPRAGPLIEATTGLNVQLLTLVVANAVWVLAHKLKLVAAGRNAGSLDGAVLQLLSIWRGTRWRGPHIAIELLGESSSGLLTEDTAHGSHC